MATQRRFLTSQVSEHRAKIAALEKEQARKEAERATTATTIAELEADIRQTLYNHETGSKWNYLEAEQSLVEQQKELNVQKSRLEEAQAAIAALKETRLQTEAEYGRTLWAIWQKPNVRPESLCRITNCAAREHDPAAICQRPLGLYARV